MTDLDDEELLEEISAAVELGREIRKLMTREMQRVGDEIAAKATEEMDLTDGHRVVFEMEDL